MSINVGQVAAILNQETQPTKTNVLWGHIVNPSFPEIIQVKYFDDNSSSWLDLTDPTRQYWLKAVIDNTITTPPVSPNNGDRYIVAAGSTGVWAGQDDKVAQFNTSVWAFETPLDSYVVNIKTQSQKLEEYTGVFGAGGSWTTLDFTQPFVPDDFQLKSQKDQALGYAGLNSSGLLADSILDHDLFTYNPTSPTSWPGGTVTVKSALDHLILNLSGGLSGVSFVADIAARDAISTPATGQGAYVTDASADPAIAFGAAFYIYNGTLWVLISAVDAIGTGLNPKASAKVTTTADITLSGEQTIDGVLTSTTRILVKDQSDQTENGVYDTDAGSWTRSVDTDTDAEVTAGMYLFVTEGTTQADTGWLLTTDDPISVGSDNLVFERFASVPEILAGNGITVNVNTVELGGSLTGDINWIDDGSGRSISWRDAAYTSFVDYKVLSTASPFFQAEMSDTVTVGKVTVNKNTAQILHRTNAGNIDTSFSASANLARISATTDTTDGVEVLITDTTFTIDQKFGPSFPGAQYVGDYSANFTARSLVDKAYVDAASTPAGSDTQVQFNNSGAFGASAGLIFDGTGLSVSVTTVINASQLSTNLTNAFAVLDGDYVSEATGVLGASLRGSTQLNTREGLNIEGRVLIASDTGTIPLISFTTILSSGAAIVTRPHSAGYNNTTKLWEVAASGVWNYQGNDQVGLGTISLIEQAAANGDVAGSGQVWVKDTVPNQLWFTDDTGIDHQLTLTIQRDTTTTTIDITAYQWNGNTDSAGFTYTLPAGIQNRPYKIVNTGTSGNTLTISPNGSDDLLGVNSNFSLFDGESLNIIFDATDGWY